MEIETRHPVKRMRARRGSSLLFFLLSAVCVVHGNEYGIEVLSPLHLEQFLRSPIPVIVRIHRRHSQGDVGKQHQQEGGSGPYLIRIFSQGEPVIDAPVEGDVVSLVLSAEEGINDLTFVAVARPDPNNIDEVMP